MPLSASKIRDHKEGLIMNHTSDVQDPKWLVEQGYDQEHGALL